MDGILNNPKSGKFLEFALFFATFYKGMVNRYVIPTVE